MDVASCFFNYHPAFRAMQKVCLLIETVIERKCGSFHSTMGNFWRIFQPYTFGIMYCVNICIFKIHMFSKMYPFKGQSQKMFSNIFTCIEWSLAPCVSRRLAKISKWSLKDYMSSLFSKLSICSNCECSKSFETAPVKTVHYLSKTSVCLYMQMYENK